MKILKNLTFTALVALAVTLLFQTPIARAGDPGRKGDNNERGERDHRDVRATFTKWVTSWPDQPGLIADMAGVVGGVVGDGSFTGEVLLYNVVDGVEKIEALYHFNGSKHSFTALVHVEQTGIKAVIIGVITEGWLKGRSVKGEYTRIECDHVGIEPFCYEGTLKIDRDSKD